MVNNTYEKRMRIVLLLLVILLTMYAPIELTRCIILNELILRLHPKVSVETFVFEIAFLWNFYLTGMMIVWKLILTNRWING